jgi:hypothetical protein
VKRKLCSVSSPVAWGDLLSREPLGSRPSVPARIAGAISLRSSDVGGDGSAIAASVESEAVERLGLGELSVRLPSPQHKLLIAILESRSRPRQRF